MPIYEYQCKKCGHTFEQLQKITDKPVVICPQCKKSSVVKLISNISFQLKGTGWYVTDFKDKGASNKKNKNGDEPPIKKQENKPSATTAKSIEKK